MIKNVSLNNQNISVDIWAKKAIKTGAHPQLKERFFQRYAQYTVKAII